ncbi:MAG TPA: hypothetical protein VIY48_07775 [Candidatus Paceibacterota bacterium]
MPVASTQKGKLTVDGNTFASDLEFPRITRGRPTNPKFMELVQKFIDEGDKGAVITDHPVDDSEESKKIRKTFTNGMNTAAKTIGRKFEYRFDRVPGRASSGRYVWRLAPKE